jgi:hypothetical protein
MCAHDANHDELRAAHVDKCYGVDYTMHAYMCIHIHIQECIMQTYGLAMQQTIQVHAYMYIYI